MRKKATDFQIMPTCYQLKSTEVLSEEGDNVRYMVYTENVKVQLLTWYKGLGMDNQLAF